MLKDSSLVSASPSRSSCGGRRPRADPTLQSMQTLLIAALVYWGMTILFSVVQSRLERRMAAGDRAVGRR